MAKPSRDVRKPPKPVKQAFPRDKPVKGWSRAKFAQAGRARSGK